MAGSFYLSCPAFKTPPSSATLVSPTPGAGGVGGAPGGGAGAAGKLGGAGAAEAACSLLLSALLCFLYLPPLNAAAGSSSGPAGARSLCHTA